MPFEVRESAVVLHSTVPDKPEGVTLDSARGYIADPLEELRDCVYTNSAPSEKLLVDLSTGFRELYKFASLLEEAFEKHVMLIATRQVQDEVAQEMERARERARAAAREEREGEEREGDEREGEARAA
jgi:hypothetical protein